MAKLSVGDWEGFQIDLMKLAEMPDEVKDEMLSAGAEVVARETRIEATKLGLEYDIKNRNERHTAAGNTLRGQRRSYTTGATAKSVSVGKMKKGKGGAPAKYVYFKGDRPPRSPNSKKIKATEVAFLNEFGSKNINQRSFVYNANRRAAKEACDEQEKVYKRFCEKNNL